MPALSEKPRITIPKAVIAAAIILFSFMIIIVLNHDAKVINNWI